MHLSPKRLISGTNLNLDLDLIYPGFSPCGIRKEVKIGKPMDKGPGKRFL